MILPRREFLRLLGVTAGAVGLSGCDRRWLVPDRRVELALRGPGLDTHAQTVCGLCEGGCGLTVRLVDGLPVGLKGNAKHPLNRGGLCPVGQAGLEVLYAPERLQAPLRRREDGSFASASWDDALGEIAGKLADLRMADRGGAVAVLSGDPGRLHHDLVERFAHALGSPNVAFVGGEAVLPYTLTQGIDEVPGFDFENADLVLTFGLDLYEDGPAPLYATSALIGSRPTEGLASLIYVGTRMSPTASKAERRVAIRSGTHAAMALGIGHVLVREGNYDRQFVSDHTFGFEDWTDGDGRRRMGFRRLLLERYYPDRVAQLCGCDTEDVLRVARRMAAAEAPVVVVGGEATAGPSATYVGMAVHSLNALLGAFDRPGGVVMPPPVPLSPLPPMGDSSYRDASALWESGFSAAFGSDPVAALADAVIDGSHPIDVLFVLSANPVHEHAAGGRLLQALEKIPLVVACAPFRNETAAAADIILPTSVFLEAWQGSTTPPTVPSSTVSISAPVVEPLFDTRPVTDILLQLADRVGSPVATSLPWKSYPDYLKARLRGVALSGQGSVISGSFAESWVHFLEERGWRFLEHASVEEFWKDLVREAGWWNPVRSTGDWDRLFKTPSGRFEFFSQSLENRLCEIGARSSDQGLTREEALGRGIGELGLAAQGDEACLPHQEETPAAANGELTLVPFRTMTGRGRLAAASPMVLEMFGYAVLSGWQTWVELAPETAHEHGVADGDRVALESEVGRLEAVVKLLPGTSAGAAHVPVGLGHSEPVGLAAGVGSNPMPVLMPQRDELSGDTAMAATKVRMRLVERRRFGGPPPIHGGHS